MEGVNHIAHGGDLLSLSEQQLVDCAFLKGYGNLGCNGGLMDSAFDYAHTNGMELEGDYGYNAVRGTCLYDSSKVATKISSWADVTPSSYAGLKSALANQPVSVAIEAD